MATRPDDADAAQHAATPARPNSSMPPKTPAGAHPSSSSDLPTPPSSGRSSHGTRHRRQSSGLRNAARALFSLPPSPGSPPAAPSPPATPAMKRPIWQSWIAAQSASSSSSAPPAPMPSTPRIPREATSDVAPIPHDQQFCNCCENANSGADTNKGKQRAATIEQQQQVVKCAVHGEVNSALHSQQPSRDREPGSLTKVEAQLQAAKAYMMRRKQGSGAGGAGGSSSGSSGSQQQGRTGSSR